MGHRIKVYIISVAAFLASQMALSLGLGEITLNSSLNQPLDAEIQLLEVRGLTQREILISLASQEDFDKIGVDKPFFLSDLRFNVDFSGSDGPVVKISSRKPVREPFLNFILQAQWPSGKLLREYTVLLDLPVFSQDKAQAVQSAQAPRTQPRTNQQAQQSSEPVFNPRSKFEPEGGARSSHSAETGYSYQSEGGNSAVDVYGPVKASDTLWEIAAQVRPDRSVSIQQTMLAIQRANPGAFINNNINLLRKGQVLRIPDRAEIQGLTRRQAVAEVAEQNSSWSGGNDFDSSDAQLEGSKSYSSYDSESSPVEGRVKLSSPDDSYDSYEGRGSGAGDSSNEALENELAITLEQLDKSKSENDDLRSKVETLEEQIKTMERLLEVSNEDLRALELSIKKNKEQTSGVDDEALAQQSVGDTGAESEGEIDTSGLADELKQRETQAEAAEPVKQEPAEVQKPAVDTKPEKKTVQKVAPSQPAKAPASGVVQLILDNIIVVIGALVVLVVGAFVFLKYRSSDDDDDFDEDFLTQPVFDEAEGESDDFAVEDDFLAESDDVDTENSEDGPEESVVQEPETESALGEPETEDVVAEADIYIAYGKYDQAEEMLLKGLSKEPENTDMILKLLEVYSNQQNVESFDPHFAKLHALEDRDAIQRGAQLRKTIPGIGQFDASAFDSSSSDTGAGIDEAISDEISTAESDAVDIDLDTDLSLDLDLDLGDDVSIADDIEEDSTDLSLDFDLSSDNAEESDEGISLDLSGLDDVSTEGESGEEEEMSFDLDLSDLDASDADTGVEGEDDLALSLDLDDLDSEDGADTGTSLSSDDDTLDLDLDLDAELDVEDESLSSLSDASEDDGDLSDLGLDLASGDESSDLAFDMGDLGSLSESDSSDSEVLDFELGESDETSDSVDLDLGDELDISGLDDIAEHVDENDATDGGLELGSDDIDIGSDLEASLDEEFEAGGDDFESAPTITETDLEAVDELDVDSDLDLSALDQELDELALDMDVDDVDDILELDDGSEAPVLDVEDELGELPELDSAVELNDGPEPSSQADNVVAASEADSGGSELEFELPDIGTGDADDDGDLGFLSDSDETATKLDLARAYIDMGDAEGAKDIIDEIMKEGNDQQKQEAEGLLARVDVG